MLYEQMKENNPIKKHGIDLNRVFATEKCQMSVKHLKKLTFLTNREIQIKTTLKFI